jgi:transposase
MTGTYGEHARRVESYFRRVATRYDKLASNFFAMVQLASMRLWLRAYKSTA